MNESELFESWSILIDATNDLFYAQRDKHKTPKTVALAMSYAIASLCLTNAPSEEDAAKVYNFGWEQAVRIHKIRSASNDAR